MHIHPTHRKDRNSSSPATFPRASAHPNQHGHRRLPASTDRNAQQCHLLALPSESLTHVTSCLTPSALLALGITCQQLCAHIRDDNIWCRAFALQFLGIAPEVDLGGDATPLFERTERSWRDEFIAHYRLTRRWARSRSQPISHSPLPSSIALLHPLSAPADGLLSASLEYGVVARSYALSGRIHKGFLDAAGTLNGVGHGNPNAEFMPGISACAITSPPSVLAPVSMPLGGNAAGGKYSTAGGGAGSAKIAWGARTGEIAVTTAAKVMDGSRVSAKLVRCRVEDEHIGAVEHAVWVATPTSSGVSTPNEGSTGPSPRYGLQLLVTCAGTGQVKIWDADGRRVRCVWTSPIRVPGSTDPAAERAMKVGADLQRGVIVLAMRSGEVIVWSGLLAVLLSGQVESAALGAVEELRIPAPEPDVPSSVTPSSQPPTALFVDASTQTSLCVLIHHIGDTYAYALHVDTAGKQVVRNKFIGPLAPISCVHLHVTSPAAKDILVVGDHLGHVHFFQVDPSSLVTASETSENAVVTTAAFTALEAHTDGSITSLCTTPHLLVTGSSRGTTTVFDLLTLGPLRAFGAFTPRPVQGGEWEPVKQVMVRGEMILVVAGGRVMACLGGMMGSVGKVVGKVGKGKKGNAAKWHQHVELSREISESRAVLENKSASTRATFGRAKEQLSVLDELGLDEVEAVEYILMLSRDEEEARAGSTTNAWRSSASAPGSSEDEGVFNLDVGSDDSSGYRPPRAPQNMAQPSSSPSPSSRRTSAGTSWVHGNAFPASLTSTKIQISPRLRPEPMEAGPNALATSFAGLSTSPFALPPPARDDDTQFPAISPPHSSISSAGATPMSAGGYGSPASGSASSKWAKPLPRTVSDSVAPQSGACGAVSNWNSNVGGSAPALTGRSYSGDWSAHASTGPSLLSQRLANTNPYGNAAEEPFAGDEEAQLRYVIELSLREADETKG